MSSNAIIARMGLDMEPFRRGLVHVNKAAEAAGKDLQKSMGDGLKNSLAGLGGAFALSEVSNQIRDVIQLGSELQDMAGQVQMSTTAFQQLVFAFGQSGVSTEETVKGLQKLSQNIKNAREGNKELIGSFAKVGITWEDLNRLNPEQILSAMANGFRGIKDPADSVGLAIDLLGKSGAKMAVAMRNGATALEQIKGQASILSQEDIDILDEYGDQIDKLTQQFRVLKAQVAVGKAPDWLMSVLGAVPGTGNVLQSITQARNAFGEKGKPKPAGDDPAAPEDVPENPIEKAKREKAEKAKNKRLAQEVEDNLEDAYAAIDAKRAKEESAEKAKNRRLAREMQEQIEDREAMMDDAREREERKEKAKNSRLARDMEEKLEDAFNKIDQRLAKVNLRAADLADPNAARERKREERRNERLMNRALREQALKDRGGKAPADAFRESLDGALEPRLGDQMKPRMRPAKNLKNPGLDKGLMNADGAWKTFKDAFDNSKAGAAMIWLKDNYGKMV